jgi:hypothetical protein
VSVVIKDSSEDEKSTAQVAAKSTEDPQVVHND